MERLPCIAFVLVAVLLVAADKKTEKAKEPAPSAAQIQQWIKQLGDESFKVREEATRDLIHAGKFTFNAAAEATKSKDPEVKQRALRIIKQIGKQLKSASISYFMKLDGTYSARGRIIVDEKSPDKPVIELDLRQP